MTKKDFRSYVEKQVRILDGAMGTQLQRRGMPRGIRPEEWILENPQTVLKIQREYVEAGSDIIYAPTFGANAVKLAGSTLASDVEGVNERLAILSKQAAGDSAMVAGDISPLGVMLDSSKGYTFDRCVNIYKEQIRGLLKGGVDLLVLETFIDIEEARAAAIAAKECCDLPVIATFAFDAAGRLLTGADALTALFTMVSVGVDAFGANCGVGPAPMLDTLKTLTPYASVPLVAKPNAGLPKTDAAGDTYFDMAPDEFSSYAKGFVELGTALIGGCCGTAPEHILAVSDAVGKGKPALPKGRPAEVLTSPRGTVFLSSDTTISEPVDISSGDIDDIIDEVLDSSEYDVIRLSCSKDAQLDIDEVIAAICAMVRQPLVFEFENPDMLARAKRIYCGVTR